MVAMFSGEFEVADVLHVPGKKGLSAEFSLDRNLLWIQAFDEFQ
jgi:hypothetical protein